MIPKPRRRWFRFSLRTMFVAVTLACLVCGWVAYSLNWIEQRRDFRDHSAYWLFSYLEALDSPTAPGFLWVFGEQGVHTLDVEVDHADDARRLFPEARINPVRWRGFLPVGR